VVKILRGVWSSAATAIAVVVSGVALAFSAWPQLRPDPQEVRSARLHVDSVEPAVTLDEYLRRTASRLEGASPQDLRTRGYVVFLGIQIEGRKYGSLELHQVLYRASTGRMIRDQGPTLDLYFRADTPKDRWINQVFVPNPPYDYRVFVRLELFDHHTLMAYADTHDIAPGR
jgi:hypothetical protein